LGGFFKGEIMELRQQLEKWSEQVTMIRADAVADMDVAKRLLKHGIESLDVIENLRNSLRETLEICRQLEPDCASGKDRNTLARAQSLLPPNVQIEGAGSCWPVPLECRVRHRYYGVKTMSKECQKENQAGHCCCNCANHIEDFYHCTTALEMRKEKNVCVCSEHKGWICMPPEFDGAAYSGWAEHGMCEMHELKVSNV
jgi:hypothetical protein